MGLAMQSESCEDFHARLMLQRRGHPVEETLARMLSSWALGVGAMPQWLGLGENRFKQMLDKFFPGFDSREFYALGSHIDSRRGDEIDDLYRLLLQNRSGRHDSELWMVDLLTIGCLGNDHLWQDLGLWQRADLSQLMHDNFAPLAHRNNKDMKWKKFLYKQLCETEGIYTCRAPSCEVCADYDHCFGAED
ncbi:MAG: nitrogen fixation protein NifQ [Candidatus Sedimenticola endophacoides]